MQQKTVQLEKLNDWDYEVTESGAKTVTWEGSKKRERNLYKLQELHRPILKDLLDSLGYEIVKEWRDSDGWDSFQVDYFEVKDRRNNNILKLRGSDDNTALYESYNGGGWGLWKSVPNTTRWFKAEKGLKNE